MTNCEGNCGTVIDEYRFWTVIGPYSEELEFCSLSCMASWLSAEVAS